MAMPDFFSAIPAAAGSWKAVVAYLIAASATLTLAMRVKRNKNLLKNLEKLPPEHRLPALRVEMNRPVYLKEGMTAEEYVLVKTRQYYFLIAIAVILAAVAIVGIAAYNSNRTYILNFLTQIFVPEHEKKTDTNNESVPPPVASGGAPRDPPPQAVDPPDPSPNVDTVIPPPVKNTVDHAPDNGSQGADLSRSGGTQEPSSSGAQPPQMPSTEVVPPPISGTIIAVPPLRKAPEPPLPQTPKPTPPEDLLGGPSERVKAKVARALAKYHAEQRFGYHKALAVSKLGTIEYWVTHNDLAFAKAKAMDLCWNNRVTTNEVCYLWYEEDTEVDKWPK